MCVCSCSCCTLPLAAAEWAKPSRSAAALRRSACETLLNPSVDSSPTPLLHRHLIFSIAHFHFRCRFIVMSVCNHANFSNAGVIAKLSPHPPQATLRSYACAGPRAANALALRLCIWENAMRCHPHRDSPYATHVHVSASTIAVTSRNVM